MRLLSNLAVLATTAALVPTTASAAVTAAPARDPGPALTLQLLNNERAARGVAPLKVDPRLGRAARGHSRDMVARRYFNHVTPDGADLAARVARTGWMHSRPIWSLGEDLAWGTGDRAAPEAIVGAWMHSPPHRRNVLDRHFHVVGIGIAAGTPFGPDGATFTADFGS